MGEVLSFDAATGETTTRPVTAEEQADADTRAAQDMQRRQVVEAEQSNYSTIRTGIIQGRTAMQQIINAADVTFTNITDAQTAMRQLQTAIKAEARQLQRLSRIALNLLDGTD